jgi:type IV secretory pathway VirD2 relaxase
MSAKPPSGPSSRGSTPPDGPAFRVRLGTTRAERAGKLTQFASRMRALATKGGGGRGRSGGGKNFSGGGRGGVAAARFGSRAAAQRVTVKARVVKAARGGKALSSIRSHLRYIRGREEELEPALQKTLGGLFGAEGALTNEAVEALAQRMAADRHHFRFIVSPEAGGELDLKRYTRELVSSMEQDLDTRLEWVAGEHRDTDNPHVHLLIRGRDARGGDLVINREYISYGLRARASDIATRHLGPRLALDIARERIRSLNVERVTGLDLEFASQAAKRVDGLIHPSVRRHEQTANAELRAQRLARLQFLEERGLAHERVKGLWEIDPDLVRKLRALGTRGDIIKQMHRRMSGEQIDAVILERDRPPEIPIVGRIAERGIADELYDRHYLVVEGLDGKSYYAPLSRYSERPGLEAPLGSIVSLKAPAARSGAADQNIASLAARHGGIYDPKVHETLAAVELKLAHVSPADFVESHIKRAQALASRGLIEALPEGGWRIPADLHERVARAYREYPGRESGKFIQVERESYGTLEEQIEARGLTWLDRELVRRNGRLSEDPAARLRASAFQQQLRQALQARVEALKAQGIEMPREGLPDPSFLDSLYERELNEAAHRLGPQHGHFERLTAWQQWSGRVAAIERLPSGPHALILGKERFALVPASPALTQRLGQSIEVSLTPPRQWVNDQARSLQIQIRHQALGLTRSRGLRR